MGRTDEVTFKCDEEGCTANASFHEPKERGFVPDEWSVEYKFDAGTDEEVPVYKCRSHTPE